MTIIRALLVLLIVIGTTTSFSLPISAHILPGLDADHTHDEDGLEMFDHYSADPDQPIYAKLAECAAIYDSAADKGPDIANFMDATYKEKLAQHALKLRDMAVVIAGKKEQEEPEQFITGVYERVYKIWEERWVFQEDAAHYALMSENRLWLSYCNELGISLNILPQFTSDP